MLSGKLKGRESILAFDKQLTTYMRRSDLAIRCDLHLGISNSARPPSKWSQEESKGVGSRFLTLCTEKNMYREFLFQETQYPFALWGSVSAGTGLR